MYFVSGFCEESSTMIPFSSPEIYKYCTARRSHRKHQYKDFRIFRCQSKDSAKDLKKELDGSNGDYEGTAAQKPHSDHSDKKRTSKFVGDIQAMIDNNPNGSVRSIARDMGVSEFLIRQVVHEDICYFSYKMRKD